jgi:hypothetical protein
MDIGPFPTLNSVQEIREFDESPEKLVDFLTSVKSHLATYILPVYQGGSVEEDVDEDWIYGSVVQYQAYLENYKSNYNFGGAFASS